MQKAICIKPETIPLLHPLLLTFKELELPKVIEIPGEQAKPIVYEYYERPMSCKTCLRYGHTGKRCHEAVAMCARSVAYMDFPKRGGILHDKFCQRGGIGIVGDSGGGVSEVLVFVN